MRNMKKFMKYLLILIGLIWGSIWLAFPSYRWHQKVTVVVETPQGVVSGSSVTKVVYKNLMQFFGMGPVRSISTRGQVPIVDLGDGKYLFALIFQDEWFPINAFEPVIFDRKELYASNVYNYFGSAFQISQERYPLLVTFGDINDPKTAREVDPDDLDASFGCALPNSEAKLWRKHDVLWRNWYLVEELAKKSYKAAEKLGFDAEQAEAITRTKISDYIRKWRNFSAHPPYNLKPSDAEYKRLKDLFPRKGPWSDWQELTFKTHDRVMIERRDVSNDCYSLKAITLEITDESVTEGKVESVLGWLINHKGKIISYSGSTRNLSDIPLIELLTKRNFLKEEK